MAGELLLTTQFAAAGLMVGLAGWLLALDAASPVHRAFAVFLVLRAGTLATNALALLDDRIGFGEAFYDGVGTYYFLGSVAALAWFLLAYPHRPATRGRTAAGVAIGALLAVALLAHAWDPCSTSCLRGGVRSYGPFAALALGLAPLSALAGAIMARRFARETHDDHRVSHGLVAAGFLMNGIVTVTPIITFWARTGDPLAGLEVNAGAVVAVAYPALTALLTIGALLLVRQGASDRPELRGAAGRIAVATGLAAAAGVLVGLPAGSDPEVRLVLSGVVGVVRLALPALVAFAILRYRLFGLDVAVRAGVRRSAIGFVFVAVFFLVSEGTEDIVTGHVDSYLGILAAGAVVLFLNPLQRAAEQMTDLAMGPADPRRTLTRAQRLVLYRDQVAAALRDGEITPSERHMLDELRAQLDLSPPEAASLERDARRRHLATSPLPLPSDASDAP